MNLTPKARRVAGLGAIVLGLVLITAAELFLRDDPESATFRDGGVAHDRGGHTARELLVGAIGMGIAIAGGVILVSGNDESGDEDGGT